MSELKQVNTRLQKMLARSREEGERRGLERGLREGERRGVEKGQQIGMRTSLEAVLETRFGAVPAWARKRIKAASEEELHRWLRRAVTAPSLKAVFEKE